MKVRESGIAVSRKRIELQLPNLVHGHQEMLWVVVQAAEAEFEIKLPCRLIDGIHFDGPDSDFLTAVKRRPVMRSG
jgi:hypothetical protein